VVYGTDGEALPLSLGGRPSLHYRDRDR
jgi:hypothetical protein